MSVRYPHRESHSTAGWPPNLETPADCLRTFFHRDHSETRADLLRGALPVGEADAIVLHDHHALAVCMIQNDLDVPRTGVFCDVVERLLGDAKKRDFDLLWRSKRRAPRPFPRLHFLSRGKKFPAPPPTPPPAPGVA